MAHYDYIILGAGASGLMLARSMAEDSWFSSRSVLIIDKDSKNQNDRTWCFWEQGSGNFDHLLSRSWDHIYFRSKDQEQRLKISPYAYKMLRSKDFYQEQFDAIHKAHNIAFLRDEVVEIQEEDNKVCILTSGKRITGTYVFNSFFDYKKAVGQTRYPVLQQHFIGWFVKTSAAVFDKAAATFMDFSVPQKGNTRFMYILPFSDKEALVEYTLFSATPLEKAEYEQAIAHYLKENLGVEDYSITEKEAGNIPMTCYNFEAANTERLIHIGTAGGWAKPSTGYTFMNTYRNTQKLIDHLKKGSPPKDYTSKTRFWYYDLLLLDILYKNNEMGSSIFGSMFSNRRPQLILKFLEERTNRIQDILVITGCPVLPFAKALIQRVFSVGRGIG